MTLENPAADASDRRSMATRGEWRVLRVDPESAEWLSLLERHPHLLFHEPSWARVSERGLAGESWAVMLKRDGEAVGGLLGVAVRSLWAKMLFFNIPYGGVIGSSPAGDELSRLLLSMAGAAGIARVRITEYPDLGRVQLDGFDSLEMRTHVLEFGGRDYDELWKGFKSRIRRDVRKAERSGVTVRSTTAAEDVAVLYELYLDSMLRNRAPAKYPRLLLNAIVDELGPLDRCAVLLAEREGTPLAGVLVADSANVSHYLVGGSRSEGLQYCPNDLLLHTALCRATHKGFAAFDFLPSGTDDPALERFKSKWGATPRALSVHTAAVQPVRMALWEIASRAAASRLGAAAVRTLRRAS